MSKDSDNLSGSLTPKFAFCVHSHQPAGNSPEVMEKVYRASYLPFFKELQKHPGVKLNAHFSGYLLEWMIDNHPDYVDMIRKMVGRGQVEILGGGLYEPILPSIPVRDAVGQIREMSGLIRKTFDITPKGIWLAERVWEPNLPSIFSAAGMSYTLIDDLGFMNAGVPRKSLAGYYTTEFDGNETLIYPINIKIRNSIPFSGHVKALNLLEKTSLENGGRLAVFGDDCEKFGSWPGTSADVYGKSWLIKFLKGLEKRKVETWKLSDYTDSGGSSGMVYLPTCSYPEMMKWALGPREQKRAETLSSGRGMDSGQIILGASWRNFFLKYHESLRLYRKIRFVSDLLHRAGHDRDALISLYKGEANDVLWHGVFGGIYLPLLRSGSYSNLINAQNVAEKMLDRTAYCEKMDQDLYGKSTYALSTGHMWAHVNAAGGLVIEELDLRNSRLNLTDTLTRVEEAYHLSMEKLLKTSARKKGNIGKGLFVKDIGQMKSIVYDSCTRATFRDHVIPENADINKHLVSHEDFSRKELRSEGYEGAESVGTSVGYSLLSESVSADVEKTISMSRLSPEITVNYRFREISGDGGFLMGSEINLSSFASKLHEINVNGGKIPSMGLVSSESSKVVLDYPRTGVSIVVEGDGVQAYHVYPVETISNSEEGLETILQGICVIATGRITEKGFSLTLKAEITGKGACGS